MLLKVSRPGTSVRENIKKDLSANVLTLIDLEKS